jgi:hypothetical protein
MNSAFVITVKIAKNVSKIIIIVLAVTIRAVGRDTKYEAIPHLPISTELEVEFNVILSTLVNDIKPAFKTCVDLLFSPANYFIHNVFFNYAIIGHAGKINRSQISGH